jgi:transposase-like protein
MTLDKTTLARLYLEEQLTIRAIAKRYNRADRTVYDLMRRWRIPRRPRGVRVNIPALVLPFDEATLRQLYLDQGQTLREVADQFQVSRSLIRKAMIRWQIPRRRCGPRPLRQRNDPS